MHTYDQNRGSTDSANLQEANGKYLFREMNEGAARDGAGFVDYMWPRPGEEAASAKLAYVQAFNPWGLIVGTGVYTDDIAVAFRTALIKQGLLAALLIVLVGGVSWAITRTITGPLSLATANMSRLAEGDTSIGIKLSLIHL